MLVHITDILDHQIERWKNDNNADMTHLNSMSRWLHNVKYMKDWVSEKRAKWFVQDVAKTLGYGEAEIAKYMGEEFVKYLSEE